MLPADHSLLESDFWQRMEFRVCKELAGAAERQLRYLWCDGFIPQVYDFGKSPQSIQGHVWMVPGQKQELWTFTLLLPYRVESRANIEWQALLPPPNMTSWLGLDQSKRHLVVDLPNAQFETAESLG